MDSRDLTGGEENFEPRDPETIKADLARCPLWILEKFSEERKKKAELERKLAESREQLQTLIAKVEEWKQRNEATLEQHLAEKDREIEQRELLLAKKTEELQKLATLVSSIQEMREKEIREWTERLQKKEQELASKAEEAAKLREELIRLKAAIKKRFGGAAGATNTGQAEESGTTASPTETDAAARARRIAQSRVKSVSISNLRATSDWRDSVLNEQAKGRTSVIMPSGRGNVLSEIEKILEPGPEPTSPTPSAQPSEPAPLVRNSTASGEISSPKRPLTAVSPHLTRPLTKSPSMSRIQRPLPQPAAGPVAYQGPPTVLATLTAGPSPGNSAGSMPPTPSMPKQLPLEKVRTWFGKEFRTLALGQVLLDPGFDLAVAVGEAADAHDSDSLATAFVNFYNYHDCILEVIKRFIDHEVAATTQAATMFRGNSIASKIMKVYSRAIGMGYLREILDPLLRQIKEKDELIEVDPNKLPDPSEAAAAAPVDLAAGMVRLRALSTQFLDAVLGSLNVVPVQFFVTCRDLVTAVSAKFPGEVHIPLAGFFFLRFMCPAIVAPDAFELGQGGKPFGANARRTLVLVSKCLQNLANNIKFTVKEPWMEGMNSWIDENIGRLQTFMLSLQNVPTDRPMATVAKVPETTALATIEKMLDKYKNQTLEWLDKMPNVGTLRSREFKVKTSTRLMTLIFEVGTNDVRKQALAGLLLETNAVAVALTKAIAGQKALIEQLAESLIAFYEAHGKSVPLLKAAIIDELSMPANPFLSSIAAKLFGVWCRLATRQWLKDTLGEELERVCAAADAYEIDAGRMLPQERGRRAANISLLLELTQTVLDLLMRSLIVCPAPLWEICNFLQLEVPKMFPNNSPNVAEFLFTMLFCPAVEKPEAYGIVSVTNPRKEARRTMYLLSDVLTNFIKGLKFYEEDPAMAKINELIARKSVQVCTFIKQWAAAPVAQTNYHYPSTVPIPWESQNIALDNLLQVAVDKSTLIAHHLGAHSSTQLVEYKLRDVVALLVQGGPAGSLTASK